MKNLILKLGRYWSAVIVTAFSIVMSLAITQVALLLIDADPEFVRLSFIIATIVPLIVAPIVSLIVNKLLFQTLELEAQLRELAATDYLTQLLSRREWMEQATRYINLATRNDSHFTVLMLDLDNFKTINDSYGHIIGDETLASFGNVIKAVCRNTDISARFGGEEFIILLPDVSEQQAVQFTDRLHQQTRSLQIITGKNIISLTVSIGISLYDPNNPSNLDTLISQSDNALYQAKKQGKNRSIIFQD